MTVNDILRLYFLGFYGVALVVLALRVLPAARRVTAVEHRPRDARRYLPAVFLPMGFLVPPAAMLFQLCELPVTWPPVRLAGFALSLWAASVLPWAAATMGQQLVPQAVVVRDHVLATAGPYRLVRHPTYSGDLALWLAAALATLNVALLALWPLYAVGAVAQARTEEQLLEMKFGEEYRSYARRVPRFVPYPPLRQRCG